MSRTKSSRCLSTAVDVSIGVPHILVIKGDANMTTQAPISQSRAAYLLAMCDDRKWGAAITSEAEVRALLAYGDTLASPEHQSVVSILEAISGQVSRRRRA